MMGGVGGVIATGKAPRCLNLSRATAKQLGDKPNENEIYNRHQFVPTESNVETGN